MSVTKRKAELISHTQDVQHPLVLYWTNIVSGRVSFNISYLVMFLLPTFNIYEDVTASSVELFVNGVQHNFILIQVFNSTLIL